MKKKLVYWLKEIYYVLSFILERPFLFFPCIIVNMFFPSLSKSNTGQIIFYLIILPGAFRISNFWGLIIGNIVFKKDDGIVKFENPLSFRGQNKIQINIDDSNRKWPTYVATFIITILISGCWHKMIMDAGTFIYEDSKTQAKHDSTEEHYKKITEDYNKIMKKINELELLQSELMKNK